MSNLSKKIGQFFSRRNSIRHSFLKDFFLMHQFRIIIHIDSLYLIIKKFIIIEILKFYWF